MHILILNWRDIKNPTGGGAEILTHELAKRWVAKGHTVTQISSSFKNAQKTETIDGVQFIRMGKWWTVHILAFFYYFNHLRKQTDIVVDEVHWFPFFSYLYAPQKTVLFACEVANHLFYTIFPLPIAFIWRLFEKFYLAIYKNVPAMAISQSTYDDLVKEGHNRKNLIILPMGLTVEVKIKNYPKEKNPTFIYVARLNKQKGIFDTLEAFSQIKKSIPNAVLWIVGSGDEKVLQEVKAIITKKKITNAVTIYGFVSEEKKFELLAKAHLLMSASVQEGWGLTVPEAGLVKTPSVVYNTQGFKDIIDNKKDGLLTDPTPEALAKGVIKICLDKELYTKMQSEAEKKAKSFSWDTSSERALQFLVTHE